MNLARLKTTGECEYRNRIQPPAFHNSSMIPDVLEDFDVELNLEILKRHDNRLICATGIELTMKWMSKIANRNKEDEELWYLTERYTLDHVDEWSHRFRAWASLWRLWKRCAKVCHNIILYGRFCRWFRIVGLSERTMRCGSDNFFLANEGQLAALTVWWIAKRMKSVGQECMKIIAQMTS